MNFILIQHGVLKMNYISFINFKSFFFFASCISNLEEAGTCNQIVYRKREPGQIHKDNSYFNFIYDDDFLFASETKIHLTLYESWKVITYQAVTSFFLKWYIQIQEKKNMMEKTTTTNTQTKKKHGSKNHGTKHIRQHKFCNTSVQRNFNSLVFKILAL